jgi:hypothetical protein
VDYEDINLYSIIRDVFPRRPLPPIRDGSSDGGNKPEARGRPQCATNASSAAAVDHAAPSSADCRAESEDSTSSFTMAGRHYLAASKEYSFHILAQEPMPASPLTTFKPPASSIEDLCPMNSSTQDSSSLDYDDVEVDDFNDVDDADEEEFEEIYDDVMNTVPQYENTAFGAPATSEKNSWSMY